jgi:hypothetical protein
LGKGCKKREIITNMAVFDRQNNYLEKYDIKPVCDVFQTNQRTNCTKFALING